jgi:hypothetical protein
VPGTWPVRLWSEGPSSPKQETGIRLLSDEKRGGMGYTIVDPTEIVSTESGGLESRVIENPGSVTKELSVRTTAWRTIRALALGALLGGVLIPCNLQTSGSPLLCTALQSAFSAMVLAALAPVRSQDLTLDLWSLPVRSEPGPGGAQENRESGGWSAKAKLGLAAL